MNKITAFLKAGVRTLRREKFFALVNVLGLSLGMFCFLITSLYVRDELTFDKWHSNGPNIFKPTAQMVMEGDNTVAFSTPHAFGDGLKEALPAVINSVNINRSEGAIYEFGGVEFEMADLFYTQPSLFDIFDFRLKYGDEKTALSEPKTVILSEELAEKHFGKNVNPIGETISFKGLGEYKITGVLSSIPGNSHLRFEMLTPIDYTLPNYESLKNNWEWGSGNHYMLLEAGTDTELLSKQAKEIVGKHTESDGSVTYLFEPFEELYMKGRTFWTESLFGGQMKYVYIFSFIGILMLAVASFNYINLTTARSIARSKDLVIRKIIGASRSKLISIQVGETFFLALIALVAAAIAVEMTLPQINDILQKRLSLNFVADPGLLVLPVVLICVVVISSGIYPAVISSSFNLASMIKGHTPKGKGAIFRKVLVVLQFLICAGLLSSGLIIRGQAKYLANLDAGYNRRNVVNIDVTKGAFAGKYQELHTELGRIPQIEMLSGSPLPSMSSVMIFPVKRGEETVQEMITMGYSDKGIVDLFELELLQGKSFSQLTESEREGAVLINESAMKKFGYDDPIGQKPLGGSNYRVVGVLKDFHFSSAKRKIEPMVFLYESENLRSIHIKFREGERDQVMAQIERVWQGFETGETYEVRDVETYFKDAYAREETLVKIFDILTGMLIVVAFLGLFALSSFENKLREREMSIRKVLGANYLSLIQVMNRRFVVLVVLAIIISVPASYYFILDWLNTFPYRIESTSSYFTLSISLILGLAIVILSVHGYRNALRNPVDILRND